MSQLVLTGSVQLFDSRTGALFSLNHQIIIGCFYRAVVPARVRS